MFFIDRGTPGLARKGNGPWKPHKAKESLLFEEGRPHTGGYLIFTRGTWQFMVLERHALYGYRPKNRKFVKVRRWTGTLNKRVLAANGRGSSRRQALRRTRRRK